MTHDHPIAAAHHLERRRRRRALFSLFGGFALVFAVLGYLVCRDEPPPDVSDLIVPRLNPPPAQNAYALFTQLVQRIPKKNSSDDAESALHDHIEAIRDGKVAWDAAVVERYLASYDDAFWRDFQTALAAPHCESPPTATYADLIPEVGPMRELVRVRQLLARQHAHANLHAEAGTILWDNFHYGARLESSKGVLITWLTASAIQGIALGEMRHYADQASADRAALLELSHRLQQHTRDTDGLTNALKLEHLPLVDAVGQVRSGKTNYADFTGFGSAARSNKLTRYGYRALGFHPFLQVNKTQRLHAEALRLAIQDLRQPASSTHSSYENFVTQLSAQSRQPINITGRVLLGVILPSIRKVIHHHHRTDANIRLTALYLALRAYHLDHDGALPDSLSALVPAYLPALPLDPFDGQPLRYSRALTTIWSIDHDRRDITTDDGEISGGKPAYRLNFARPVTPLPTFAEWQKQSAAAE
jgi:hypothetical protein